tara:strand:- start:716 stop:910 length:195 start_codon:yes stop_codon:yes gene_type:complete
MDRVALDIVLTIAQRFGINPEDVEYMFDGVDTVSTQQVRKVMVKLNLSAKQVIEAYRYLHGGTR